MTNGDNVAKGMVYIVIELQNFILYDKKFPILHFHDKMFHPRTCFCC